MITLVLLSLWIAPPALTADSKSTGPQSEAWQNVDKELGKGARKIKGFLERNGVATEEKTPPPEEKKLPSPTAENTPTTPQDKLDQNSTWGKFRDEANRIWFNLLGKGDEALETQRVKKAAP